MAPDGTALLLVDHGSRRDEANAQLEQVAERVRARRPGLHVETAHLEIAPPTIADGIATCAAAGVRELVVVPWFLSRGRHTTRDIPAQVEEASARHPELRIRIAAPLGVEEAMIDLVLAKLEQG